uniref:Uncharacterized protein n=1 Tax=Arion vulgaris TaxID=1028688 RepID=A0A0B6YYU9_9EUPU
MKLGTDRNWRHVAQQTQAEFDFTNKSRWMFAGWDGRCDSALPSDIEVWCATARTRNGLPAVVETVEVV